MNPGLPSITVEVTPHQWVKAVVGENKETAAGLTAVFGILLAGWKKYFKKKKPFYPSN